MTNETLHPAEEYEEQVIGFAFQELLMQKCDELDNEPLTPEEEELMKQAEAAREKHLKQIDRNIRRRDLIRQIKAGTYSLLKYAAIFVTVVSVGFGTAFAVSRDFRVIVVDFLNIVTDEYVRVGQDRYDMRLHSPRGWIGRYYPTYMPEGYELAYHYSNTGYSKVDYKKSPTEKITLAVSNSVIVTHMNAENAQCQIAAIGDFTAYWYTTDTYSLITWFDGTQYYSLSATLPSLVLDVVESLADTERKES